MAKPKTSAQSAQDKKKELFLTQLRLGWSISRACRKSVVGRRTAYDWKSKDKDFSDEWDAAVEEGTDRLEDIAQARGMRMSDTLLIFMLKGRRPQKFRDNHPSQNEDPTETASKIRQAVKELDAAVPSPT